MPQRSDIRAVASQQSDENLHCGTKVWAAVPAMISRIGALAASVALATVVSAPAARAKTFVVDNPSDPVVGKCDRAGACTLRQAINEAVATPGRDVITFAPAVFPLAGPAGLTVESPLPAIADPAGTVLDGTPAGVVIRSQIPSVGDDAEAPNGLVFESAPGVALRDVAVLNVTVTGFAGSAIVICGGTHFECDQDVVAPVVRRVTARQNGETGISIQGHDVTKARIDESSGIDNGSIGMLIDGFGTVTGARITRSAVKGNDLAGLWVGPLTAAVSDLAISDLSASGGEAAIVISAFDDVTKVALTNVAVSAATDTGIYVNATALSAFSATTVVASRNERVGMFVDADTISGLALKDVVTNANEFGIRVDGDAVVGAKLTQVTAAGNTANGITLRELENAKISRVTAVGNGAQGIVLRGTGNVLKQVRVAENSGDGLRLAGPGGGNRVADVSATANQGAGIYVDTDNRGNTLRKNFALGSAAFDLFDANSGCGTNVWKSNVFELRNDACIR